MLRTKYALNTSQPLFISWFQALLISLWGWPPEDNCPYFQDYVHVYDTQPCFHRMYSLRQVPYFPIYVSALPIMTHCWVGWRGEGVVPECWISLRHCVGICFTVITIGKAHHRDILECFPLQVSLTLSCTILSLWLTSWSSTLSSKSSQWDNL